MDAEQVREQLEEGNRRFAAAQAAESDYGESPAQQSSAAVRGCSDARAPIERLFQQGVNELFVVRVAGNGLGAEQLESLAYAALHLGERLRLAVVLGHSGCGAVSAAVDSHLQPAGYPVGPFGAPIRAIVDRALVSVQISARALACVPAASAAPAAYRAALIETSIAVNAGLNAAALQRELADQLELELGVAFGVYDLGTRRVGVAGHTVDGDVDLLPPPADAAALDALAARVASSPRVADLLRG